MKSYRPIFGGAGAIFYEPGECANAQPGDTIILRDFEALTAGKAVNGWEFRPYELADGETGKMLWAFGVYRDDPDKHIPDELTIDLGLTGTYSIWLGIPKIEIKQRIYAQGADIALDGEGFTCVTPYTGTRHGNAMGPTGCEKFIFWRNADLTGRTLRIRIPFGQCGLWPYGIINSVLTSIRLTKIDPEDAFDHPDKDVAFIIDGFSHYLNTRVGEEFDSRFVDTYRNRGVSRIIWQSPATGVVAWPSEITGVPGDDMSQERWNELRVCDRRIHDYLKWANEAGCEGIKTVSDACRREKIEFHLSIRMNLYWRINGRDHAFAEYINGRWWREHPEALIENSCFIDYAKPVARKFICDILAEAAKKYRFDGFCMDLTRWPPVFGGAGHTSELLPVFIREIRETLGKKIKLGFIAVEGYHANRSLAQQHIDIEEALKTGCVDYFGVQAYEQAEYVKLARKYGVDYTLVQEQEAVYNPGGLWKDPLWQDPVLKDSDPIPGEEFWDVPRVSGTLSMREYDVAVARAYAAGARSVSITNNDFAYLLGGLGNSRQIQARLESGSLFGQVDGHQIVKF